VSGLRIIESAEAGPIPISQAQDAYKAQWREARIAYVEMLDSIHDLPVKRLLISSGSLTAAEIKAVRNSAAETARKANAMLAALDATVDIVYRAVPDPKPTP
jgi:hypothetical protein